MIRELAPIVGQLLAEGKRESAIQLAAMIARHEAHQLCKQKGLRKITMKQLGDLTDVNVLGGVTEPEVVAQFPDWEDNDGYYDFCMDVQCHLANTLYKVSDWSF